MAQCGSSRKNVKRSSSAQIKLIVDYMADNKDFANGLGEYAGVTGAIKAEEQWEALREKLSLFGANKSVMQWKLTWRDLKAKARKALKENKNEVPLISEGIYKILDTIGHVNQDCSIQIKTTGSDVNESLEWAVEPEENSLIENSIDNQNGEQSDKESARSSELEAEYIEDKNSMVEITMPLPMTDNKPLHDPLQAATTSIPRLPRLAPKPHPSKSNDSYSPYQRPSSSPFRRSQSPSLTRRRHLIMARRRKIQNIFHQVSSDFVSLEQQRLRMEEERDRRLHEREMERLKLELQRIEVQRNHNELLQHLVTVAQNAYELLQQKLL